MRTHEFILELLVFSTHLLNLLIKKLEIMILPLNFLPTLIDLFLTLVICNLEIEDLLLHIVDDLKVLNRFLLSLLKLLVNVLVNLPLVYLLIRDYALVHRRLLSLLRVGLILEVRNDTVHFDVVNPVFYGLAN